MTAELQKTLPPVLITMMQAKLEQKAEAEKKDELAAVELAVPLKRTCFS